MAGTSIIFEQPWMKWLNKMLIRVFPVLSLILIAPLLYGHSGKPKYHVIIDSDGAIDDLRAVTNLLACNEIRVLGIIGSQGTLPAKSSADKVSSLLAYFHHEGIPVGIGQSLNLALPFWSAFASTVPWGNNEYVAPTFYEEAVSLMTDITKSYPQKITMIALGALTNVSDWLRSNPRNTQKVERIIWYNDIDFKNGFNTGDIMVLFGKDAPDIELGDIIVFRSNNGEPIIHRVINSSEKSGMYSFQTKGDHNANPIRSANLNEYDIGYEKILGKAVFRIPYLGWIKIVFFKGVSLLVNQFQALFA